MLGKMDLYNTRYWQFRRTLTSRSGALLVFQNWLIFSIAFALDLNLSLRVMSVYIPVLSDSWLATYRLFFVLVNANSFFLHTSVVVTRVYEINKNMLITATIIVIIIIIIIIYNIRNYRVVHT